MPEISTCDSPQIEAYRLFLKLHRRFQEPIVMSSGLTISQRRSTRSSSTPLKRGYR